MSDPLLDCSPVFLSVEVMTELHKARKAFPPIASPHEGLAIIWEEFEEFKEEVFRHNLSKGRDTRPRQREELIQLAAMCLRAIADTLPAAVDNGSRDQ